MEQKTETLKTKTYKTTPEYRNYQKNYRRKERNWKCTRCGNLSPIVKTLNEKEKLCEACNIEYLKERFNKKEEEQTKDASNGKT